MESSSQRRKKDQVRNRSTSGAIRIASAEGRGVGRTVRGAEDARNLAREALLRAGQLRSRNAAA
jgi:hypothetical protein